MTDKVRKTVSFPEELETQIARRAQRFDRSFSAQVVADMRTVVERAIHRDEHFLSGGQSSKLNRGIDEE